MRTGKEGSSQSDEHKCFLWLILPPLEQSWTGEKKSILRFYVRSFHTEQEVEERLLRKWMDQGAEGLEAL